MSIDWITVAAQIANFMVLIWLLKRFLYRPILDGIDAREKEIADRMAEAAQIRARAEAVEADYAARAETLRAEREKALADARTAAAAERDALLTEARKRVAHDEADRAAQRAEEARRYTEDLHRSGASALLSLTRKALTDLADETLEARVIAHFTPRIAAMAGELRKAAGDSPAAMVLTREPLTPKLRQGLSTELAKVVPGVKATFKADPAQSPGVTLRLGGAQVAWTLESYMTGLDDLLADVVAAPSKGDRSDAV